MPTANEALQDLAIRHQVGLQRLSTGTVKKIVRLLDKVDADLVDQIRKRDPNAVSGAWSTKRIERMLEEVRKINRDAYRIARNGLRKEMADLAEYEADFQRRMFGKALPIDFDIVTPAREQLVAAATAQPFQGKFLKEWFEGLEAGRFSRLRDAIRIGFTEGETVDQVVRRIRGTRALNFKDGILETSRRSAEAVTRTAMNHTATAARETLYKENSDLIKGVRWASTLDSRTTPICMSRDGNVYKPDNGPRPPAHINCLPADTLVTTRDGITGASKHWYDGELVVIRTAGGKELTSTPNHPILTDSGWVAAHRLDVGDNVICDGGAQRGAAAVNVDHQDVPARIEEVAEAAFGSLEMATMPVPTTAEDFHGDGMDGDVAIVASNRLLAGRRHASLPEQGGESALVGGNMRLAPLSGLGDLASVRFAVRLATDSVMRSLGQCGALLGRGARHTGGLLLRSVSHLHAVISEYASHGARRDIVVVGNAEDPYAALEEGDSFWDRNFDSWFPSARPTGLASAIEPTEDGVGADTELAANILGGAAGAVFVDDIVDIQRRDFSGHVFNLETEKGFYIANDIVTHNCRSTTVPVTKSWRELGIDMDEAPPGTRASMNGQVPDKLTYGEWLRKQSAEVQDEALGKTKGKLFRKGNLGVDKFVSRRGDELTLDELRVKEAAAFKKAGLDEQAA